MSSQNQAADATDAAASATEVKQTGTDQVERDASTALSTAAWTLSDTNRSMTAPNAVSTLNRLESDGTMARLFGGNVNWEGENALAQSKTALDKDGSGTLEKTELQARADDKTAPALDRFRAQYLLKNWKAITGSDTATGASDAQIRTFAQKQQSERDALVRRQVGPNVTNLTNQFEQLYKDPNGPNATRLKADIERTLGTAEYNPATRTGALNRAALAQNLIDKDLGGLVAKDQLTPAATAADIKMSDISTMSTKGDLKGLAAEIVKRDHFKVDNDSYNYDRISVANLTSYAASGETKYRPGGVPAATVDTTVSTNIGRDVQDLATNIQGLLANPNDSTMQASINDTLKKPEYAPGSPKHTALMTELEKRGADGRLIQNTLGQDFWSGNTITRYLGGGFTSADLASEAQKKDNPIRSLAATLAQRNLAKINTDGSNRMDSTEIEAYSQKENADLISASNGARTERTLSAANNTRDVLASPDAFSSADISSVDAALKRGGDLNDPAIRRKLADAMRDRGLDGKLLDRAFKDSGDLKASDLERIANDRNASPSQRVAAEIAKANFEAIQRSDNFWDVGLTHMFDGDKINASERKAWGDKQIVSAAPLTRTNPNVDKSADAIRELTLSYSDNTATPASRQQLEKAAADSLRRWMPSGTQPDRNVEDLAKGVTKGDVDTLLASNWDKMFPGKTSFNRQDLARLSSDNNPLTRATARLAARQYADKLTSDTASIAKTDIRPPSFETLAATDSQRDQRRGNVISMAQNETADSLKAKMFSGDFDTTKPDVSKPRAEAMAALLRQANRDVPETGRQNTVNIDVDTGDGKKTTMTLQRQRIGADNWMISAFVNGKPVMRAIDTKGDIYQQSERIGSQDREVRMFEDSFKKLKQYQAPAPEAAIANPIVTSGDVVTDPNAAMNDRAKELFAMENGAKVTVTVNGKDVQATVVKKGTWIGLMMPATDGHKPGFILKADVRRDGKVTPDGGQWTQTSWRDTGPDKWAIKR